ncbi:NTP transferase domain-containing protein [Halostella litorea]|uniref:NTP transferase domain-containing protein n=1 Tax=Halostella litorea TaxID=2528831 RepID=UPI001386F490|nr:NTP transferase domain-containing protein [Halostella litorea]
MTVAGIVAGGCRPDGAERPADGDGTLVRRVAGTLSGRTDRLVVTCRPDRRDAVAGALDGLDARLAPDPAAAGGPAATLRAGLRTCGCHRAAVVAPDVAAVDGRAVGLLVEALDASDADAAVPRIDGRQRPLCAVYDVAAAVDACTTALRRGEGDVRGVLTALSVADVDEARFRSRVDPATLRRVDSPAALRAPRDPSVEGRSESD